MPAARLVRTPDGWTHAEGGKCWRAEEDGVWIRDRTPYGIPRLLASKINTDLAAKVVAAYGDDIATQSQIFGVSPIVVATTIVVESAGNASAERYEAQLNDYSIGLGQHLTATAFAIARLRGVPTLSEARAELGEDEIVDALTTYALPDRSLPAGGDLASWRHYLGTAWNSIMLTCALHGWNNARFTLGGDPVAMYACWNAGSLRRATNQWGLVSAGNGASIDSFAGHYYHVAATWREQVGSSG